MSDPILNEEDDLISQDDIDRLMETSSVDDDTGELFQDDIDSLLNESGPDEEGLDPGEEVEGELSQDDIDRMMAVNVLDDDDELISLEDIQGVISGDTQDNVNDASDSGAEPDPVPAVEAESRQDDVTKPEKEEAPVEDAPVPSASTQAEDPFDEPIDESQAADVADCMITQDAMDALIEAALPVPDVPEEGDWRPEADDGDGGEDDLPDPINLVSETDGDDPGDAIQESEDEITQEDIDALLQQSDEKDELLDEDEDILISQDDINTLLMATDQEDEDILGDISGEDDVSDLEDHRNDVFDELESDAGQVVLEEIDGAGHSDGKESSPAVSSKIGVKALFKARVILAAASVLLFMGISVPLSYFLFFSSEPEPLPERQAASLTEIDLIQDGQDTISEEMPVLPPSRRAGTILLPDFIILASDQSRTMTYVSADVSIDYSDQRAYDEINGNLAFYRDLIYEAIQTRLVSEKNNEVTEADLLWGVEVSLKKVLPPQYIDKISFESFSAT